jgi:hypothetical protein
VGVHPLSQRWSARDSVFEFSRAQSRLAHLPEARREHCVVAILQALRSHDTQDSMLGREGRVVVLGVRIVFVLRKRGQSVESRPLSPVIRSI